MKLTKAIIILLLVFPGKNYAQAIYAGRYKAVFTQAPKQVPTSKTPDAPLAGNGDIGLTMGGTPDNLCFYLGKNDFWRAYPVYPGGGIALPGGLNIGIDALKGASYYAEQIQDKAAIVASFQKDNLKVTLHTWVAAENNVVIAEFTANQTCRLKLNLWSAKGNTSVNYAGKIGDVLWVSRSFENTPLLAWPAHVIMAMKVLGSQLKNDGTVTLSPGQKVTLSVTMYTNFDRKDWKNTAITEAQALTQERIAQMRVAHEKWWAHFWARSTIRIADTILEKYYFASQYLFACTTRGNKFAPGIWGPFITRDSTSWGGDYHLNYNYEAPFWAAYSSNYIDLIDNYDQPLLDYMKMGEFHARDLLHMKGIYYPVGIGPKGLCTTRWPLTPDEMEKRYGSREDTIDHGYKFLGQKINAVFGAGNMLMRFYSTYDVAYARRIYPYLLQCANFWEDYLKFENGRYVIYNDHFGEVMPNLKNKGVWRNQLGDFNSTLSLGLVRMLFKGIIDVSTFLNVDANRQAKWQHIRDHISDFPTGDINGRPTLKSVEKSPSKWLGRPGGLSRVSIHGLILPGGTVGPISTPELNKILLSDISHWKDRAVNPADWGNTLGNGIETCFPGAVRVGYDPDDILKYLKARIAAQSLPNLWVTQTGGGIETLAAVPLTINEMLMQSYEGVLRIFPNWNHAKDASFDKLRAYGAFVVSSSLKNGSVEYVNLLSEKGRNCTMENPWPGKKVQLTRNGQQAETLMGKTFVFNTKTNEKINFKATEQ
jgi:alpha-L-fucosidase 2